MFEDLAPVATTVHPGPNWGNTFDPAAHQTPPRYLQDAVRVAALERRPYLLWNDQVLIVTSASQHLVTSLTRADVAMPPPAAG